jgi:hypothetical protein
VHKAGYSARARAHAPELRQTALAAGAMARHAILFDMDSRSDTRSTRRKRTYVLGLLGAACVIALVVAVAQRAPTPPVEGTRAGEPTFSLETTSIDLGRTGQDHAVEATITFTNTGDADLVISDVRSA